MDQLISTGNEYQAKQEKPLKPIKKKAKISEPQSKTTDGKETKNNGNGKKSGPKKKGNGEGHGKEKKKGEKKGKGQYKGKAEVDDGGADTDHEDETGEKKKKGLDAKVAIWQDIPDWGDRTDCPLLQLPVEILDLCFGLNSGLRTRDYLAVSGVSKFFREKFTSSVFHEIYYNTSPYDTLSWQKYKVKHTNVPKPKRTGQADRIFSRTAKIQYMAPEMEHYKYGTPDHYIPAGRRQEWSEAQYTVYKEEQAKWRGKERKKAMELQRTATAENNSSHDGIRHFLQHDGRNRTILGMVRGLKDGEAPADRSQMEDASIFENTGEETEEEDQTSEGNDQSNPTRPVIRGRPSRRSKTRGWTVPETDDEQEICLKPLRRDPKTGDKIVHDYWPNSWRRKAAKSLWHTRISKTTAMTTYKVTEAQLLCLSHVVIPNAMGGKHGQHMYITAAVEALAYRAHGGPLGHEAHLIKADKAAKVRQDKIAQAKAEGTFVKKYKRHNFPHWAQFDWDFYGKHCGRYCECGGWDPENDPSMYHSAPRRKGWWW
ncbi:hypothetical protein I317_01916 [Kwoniella heveanensis CBS 569]|nr:hypothetical protein I317_01916 [Kwoniella heveanensis CBS 569]